MHNHKIRASEHRSITNFIFNVKGGGRKGAFSTLRLSAYLEITLHISPSQVSFPTQNPSYRRKTNKNQPNKNTEEFSITNLIA